MSKYIHLISPLLVFLVFGYVLAQDFCNMQSCIDYDKGEHTMCTYQSPDPASTCGEVLSGGVTRAERKIIVDKHNELRQKVASGQETRGMYQGGQPAAANMPDLKWDNTLAMIAQRWASQCAYGHDPCRDVDQYQVGQNVAQGWATGNMLKSLTVESMVQGWYDEVAVFDSSYVDAMGPLENNRGQDVGHYTQLVWAETVKVGCGKMMYKQGTRTYLYLVCNYGPSGNFPGQPIYERA